MEIICEKILGSNKITEYADGTGKVEQIYTEDNDIIQEELIEPIQDIDKLELNEKIDYLTTLLELQGGLINV